MILDIFLVLIVTLFVFIGYRKGIVRSLYGLLSLIIAGITASFVCNYLSVWIYNVFFSRSVNESINNSISDATQNTFESYEVAFKNLPESVKDLFSFFGVDNKSLSVPLESTGQTIAKDLQNIVMNATVSLLRVIILVVVFVLLIVLLKILSKQILMIFELPIIKQINGVFGIIFGLIEGLVICYITILVLKLLIPYVDLQFITPQMIEQSLFFNRIYYSSFIEFLLSVC